MNPLVFVAVWFIVVIPIIPILYIRGRKILLNFPDINSVQIIYRDMRASGYDSIKNDYDTVRGYLDIVVTEDELWLKCGVMGAEMQKNLNLIHKIPFKNIHQVIRDNKRVVIEFYTQDGEFTRVNVKLKNIDKFIDVISSKSRL